MTRRTVAWSKADPFGAELASVEIASDRMSARGVAIGSEPEPYRLDYELTTTEGFVTRRVVVTTIGQGWSRRLELEQSGASSRRRGRWRVSAGQEGDVDLPDAGGNGDRLGRALDPDLGLSPLFNTMPVLRHRIHDGGPAEEFVMVWISVPDLSIHVSPQRYTHLVTRSADERLIRFEAVGSADDFAADVVFDRDGLVVDYPGIAARIRAGGGSR